MARKRDKKEKESGSFFRSRTFIGLLCIAASLILYASGLFLPQLLNSQTTVVVMARDVAKGERLSAEDVRQEKVFTSSVKALSPVKDVSSVQGKYSSADLYAGDILTQVKLSSSPTYNDPDLYTLAEGKLAFSIAIDSLEEALADKLIPGDVVTVYALQDNMYTAYGAEPESGATLYPQLRYVKVLAVTDAAGYDIDNAYKSRAADGTQQTRATAAVTLEVNGDQALLLAGIQAGGHFHLALSGRGPSSAALLQQQEDYFALLAAQQAAEMMPAEELPDE